MLSQLLIETTIYAYQTIGSLLHIQICKCILLGIVAYMALSLHNWLNFCDYLAAELISHEEINHDNLQKCNNLRTCSDLEFDRTPFNYSP
jgi:hypothetical protein